MNQKPTEAILASSPTSSSFSLGKKQTSINPPLEVAKSTLLEMINNPSSIMAKKKRKKARAKAKEPHSNLSVVVSIANSPKKPALESSLLIADSLSGLEGLPQTVIHQDLDAPPSINLQQEAMPGTIESTILAPETLNSIGEILADTSQQPRQPTKEGRTTTDEDGDNEEQKGQEKVPLNNKPTLNVIEDSFFLKESADVSIPIRRDLEKNSNHFLPKFSNPETDSIASAVSKSDISEDHSIRMPIEKLKPDSWRSEQPAIRGKELTQETLSPDEAVIVLSPCSQTLTSKDKCDFSQSQSVSHREFLPIHREMPLEEEHKSKSFSGKTSRRVDETTLLPQAGGKRRYPAKADRPESLGLKKKSPFVYLEERRAERERAGLMQEVRDSSPRPFGVLSKRHRSPSNQSSGSIQTMDSHEASDFLSRFSFTKKSRK